MSDNYLFADCSTIYFFLQGCWRQRHIEYWHPSPLNIVNRVHKKVIGAVKFTGATGERPGMGMGMRSEISSRKCCKWGALEDKY